ncbi:MAG TPA: hypothetical protein VNO21_14430 [Polyangiaceae bacterium]|nr:hypothetical protein [Polyangiaceae bacterium]
MSPLVAVVGWIGAAVLVSAYALVSMRKLASERAAFQIMNLAGSAALAVNSAANGAWPSTSLNIVWMAIGAVALFRIRWRYR